jgi:hypothetical protein
MNNENPSRNTSNIMSSSPVSNIYSMNTLSNEGINYDNPFGKYIKNNNQSHKPIDGPTTDRTNNSYLKKVYLPNSNVINLNKNYNNQSTCPTQVNNLETDFSVSYLKDNIESTEINLLKKENDYLKETIILLNDKLNEIQDRFQHVQQKQKEQIISEFQKKYQNAKNKFNQLTVDHNNLVIELTRLESINKDLQYENKVLCEKNQKMERELYDDVNYEKYEKRIVLLNEEIIIKDRIIDKLHSKLNQFEEIDYTIDRYEREDHRRTHLNKTPSHIRKEDLTANYIETIGDSKINSYLLDNLLEIKNQVRKLNDVKDELINNSNIISPKILSQKNLIEVKGINQIEIIPNNKKQEEILNSKNYEKNLPNSIDHVIINEKNNSLTVENICKFSYPLKIENKFKIENVHKEPIFFTQGPIQQNSQDHIFQDKLIKTNLENKIKNLENKHSNLEEKEMNKKNYSFQAKNEIETVEVSNDDSLEEINQKELIGETLTFLKKFILSEKNFTVRSKSKSSNTNSIRNKKPISDAENEIEKFNEKIYKKPKVNSNNLVNRTMDSISEAISHGSSIIEINIPVTKNKLSDVTQKIPENKEKEIEVYDGALYLYRIYDNKRILRFDIETRKFKVIEFADFGNFEEDYNSNGSIYLNTPQGLFTVTGKNHDKFYFFNAKSKTMIKLGQLNDNHTFGSLIYYEKDNSLICLSGWHNKKVEKYYNDEIISKYLSKSTKRTNISRNNSLQNKWNYLPEMKFERSECPYLIINEIYLYAFFGFNCPRGIYLETIERLNLNSATSSNTWEEIKLKNEQHLSTMIKSHTCLMSLPNEILFIGGYDGQNEIPVEKMMKFKIYEKELIPTDRKFPGIINNHMYNFQNDSAMVPFIDVKNRLHFACFDENDRIHSIEVGMLTYDIFKFD